MSMENFSTKGQVYLKAKRQGNKENRLFLSNRVVKDQNNFIKSGDTLSLLRMGDV